MQLEFKEFKDSIHVSCNYWETIHAKENGGALSSLVFKYGSGKNILASPVTSYIRRKEGTEFICYYESLYKTPTVTMARKNDELMIDVSGKYVSTRGDEIPVIYKRKYRYQSFGIVRVSIEIEFVKSLSHIVEIGVSGFHILKNIDVVGYRPSPEADQFSSDMGFCQWHEFERLHSYRNSDLYIRGHIPMYICFIDRGVEGFEIFRGDGLEVWKRPFGEDDGHARFHVCYDVSQNAFLVELEHYSNRSVPLTVNPGKYKFDYYLGLPFSKGRNKVHRPYFHAPINSIWPDENQLDIYAEAGIKLLRLHNDYRENGPFWRDGYYPPYDKENMARMDWVIEEVHKRGMKIVPYFSLKEFHPDCPEYSVNVDKWKRTTDKKFSVIHNYIGSGEYGAQMCLRSGWLEFRKKSIDIVLSNHNFDGVYYDWTLGYYCNNPVHAAGIEHTDMDEFVKFLQWTRKRVSPEGIVFLHMSGVPMMVAENLADLIFTHEELCMISPRPGGFSPHCDFVGITGHQVVRNVACKNLIGERDFVLSCFLESFWISPKVNAGINDQVLIEMKKFSKYNLESYLYEPASKKPVFIDVDNIRGSLYWSVSAALIYMANLSDRDCSFNWRLNLAKKGWNGEKRIEVKNGRKSIFLTVNDLSEKGINSNLRAWSSELIEVKWEIV